MKLRSFGRGFAITCMLAGCAGKEGSTIESISIASSDPLPASVGEQVHLTIRAVMDDGSSIDVTTRSTCALDTKDAPGTLDGLVFTATKPGTTNVVCTFLDQSGTLGLTVPGAATTTIASVQKGNLQQNAEVAIHALVYAVVPDGAYTNFYAQDPGGGPFSGIYMIDVRPLGDAGAPAAPVKEGDLIDVHGIYTEKDGRSVIRWDRVSVAGTGAPKADVVPAGGADAATWDGCFVEVDDVQVTNPNVDGYTWEVAAAANASGPKQLVETIFYDAKPAADARYAFVRGPLYVKTLKTGPLEVAIAPRNAGDAVAGN